MNEPCIAPKPGLRGAKVHGCNCGTCLAAAREHANRRNRLIAYGQWNPYVDAEPARRHVRNLMAAGLGWQRLCVLSGIPQGTISRLLYGIGTRPPSKRIRPETERRILAVQVADPLLADAALIDGTGTRRRMGALAAIGWSLSKQAAQLGRLTSNYARIISEAPPVQVATARAVADLYARLAAHPAPAGPSATKARRWAARNGWEPPTAWDESTIDDPDAVPYGDLPDANVVVDWVAVERALKGAVVSLTRMERHHAVHAGRERGWAYTRIAEALRMSVSRAQELGAKPLPEGCEVAA